MWREFFIEPEQFGTLIVIQGNENLPWSLLSPSVVNIPDYWT